MLFEVSNDLVPILLSMSICLSLFAIHFANIMVKEHAIKQRFSLSEKFYSLQDCSIQEGARDLLVGQTQQFITRIIKRKEAPEDDSDYVYSLRKEPRMDNRGGIRWKIALYLPFLKNTALFS